MRFTTFLAYLLSCSAVVADPPVANITGPTSGTPGDIVELDASASVADQFAWIVNTDSVRVPSGALTHKSMNDGRALVLASYPGTWRVYLLVSNSDAIRFQQWTVKIEGGGDDGPPPGDDGPPNAPDLSSSARLWLQTVSVAHRAPQKNIGLTFSEIGKQWKEIGSNEAMDALLGVGVAAALQPLNADARQSWTQFIASANGALEQLKSQNVSVEHYGAALVSIAKGLE